MAAESEKTTFIILCVLLVITFLLVIFMENFTKSGGVASSAGAAIGVDTEDLAIAAASVKGIESTSATAAEFSPYAVVVAAESADAEALRALVEPRPVSDSSVDFQVTNKEILDLLNSRKFVEEVDESKRA